MYKKKNTSKSRLMYLKSPKPFKSGNSFLIFKKSRCFKEYSINLNNPFFLIKLPVKNILPLLSSTLVKHSLPELKINKVVVKFKLIISI